MDLNSHNPFCSQQQTNKQTKFYRLPQIGDGRTVLDLTHVTNVCHAVFLACEAPREVCHGKVYNITDCNPQKLWDVLGRICDELYMPRPRLTLPHWLAFYLAYALEMFLGIFLKLGINTPEPLLSRYAVNVLSTSQTLDCSLAKRDLRYSPAMPTERGIGEFIDSIRAEELALPLKRSSPLVVLWITPCIHALSSAVAFHYSGVLLHKTLPVFSTSSVVFVAAMFVWMAAWFMHSRGKGLVMLAMDKKRARQRAQHLTKLGGSAKMAAGLVTARARPWRLVSSLEDKFNEATRAAPAAALSPIAISFAPALFVFY